MFGAPWLSCNLASDIQRHISRSKLSYIPLTLRTKQLAFGTLIFDPLGDKYFGVCWITRQLKSGSCDRVTSAYPAPRHHTWVTRRVVALQRFSDKLLED